MSPGALPNAAVARQFAEMEPAMNARLSRLVAFSSALCAVLLVQSTVAKAAGTTFNWANAASGSWDTAANWDINTIADGAGNVAVFNPAGQTTADITVTMAAPHTIGQLVFGATGSSAGWILGGTQTLTLDNTGGTGGPVITVNALASGKTALINDTLAGTAGFTKNGAGELVINAQYAAGFTGATVMDGGGTLTFSAANPNVKALQFGVVTAGVGSASVDTLNINDNVTGTSLSVQTGNVSANTLNIASGKTLTINGPITVGYDLVSAAANTARLNITGSGSLVAGASGQILTVGTQSTSGNANSITSIL